MKTAIAQVHYTRFMMTVCDWLSKLSNPPLELVYRVAVHMCDILQSLESAVSSRKENGLKLPEFEGFASSPVGEKVLAVVQRYSHKFSAYRYDMLARHSELAGAGTRSPKPLQRQVQEYIQTLAVHLRANYRQASSPPSSVTPSELREKDARNSVVALDYLVTLWQLLEMEAWDSPREF